MSQRACKHKIEENGVVLWKCNNQAAAGRWECNQCKNRHQRGRTIPIGDAETRISCLENKLELMASQKEELHKDYTELLKQHAELTVSYKNLLEESLVTRMEKNLVIAPPIFCPDCKKRRRKVSGRPPKDPCDCVLP